MTPESPSGDPKPTFGLNPTSIAPQSVSLPVEAVVVRPEEAGDARKLSGNIPDPARVVGRRRHRHSTLPVIVVASERAARDVFVDSRPGHFPDKTGVVVIDVQQLMRMRVP